MKQDARVKPGVNAFSLNEAQVHAVKTVLGPNATVKQFKVWILNKIAEATPKEISEPTLPPVTTPEPAPEAKGEPQ